jgi:Tol biopolymer transport system component
MDYHCVFSPDGKQIALTRQTIWQFWDIWVAPFPGGEVRRLTHDNKTATFPAWTHDGREIIFRSNRLGSDNLWRISADAVNGTEPTLIPDTGGVRSFAISIGPPARLVFSRGVIDINIWATEILPDNLNYGPPKPVIQSTREDRGAQFSPDGRRIVYTSGRAGELGIWIAASDGSNPIQLTTNNVSGAKDWSPDGSKIAFDYLQDLYIMDTSGGEPRPVLKGPASDNRPHWSRDGKNLYFHSDRSGTRQIWKMPAAGGEPIQVTRGGGIEGWEAPDGKTLYYARSWDAPGLWVVPVGGGEEKPMLDAVWHGYWALADAGIYFVDFMASKPPMLSFFDFKTRKVKGILSMDKVARTTQQNLTVTRDGRKIAWHQVDRNESDLMQIENFR